MTLSPLRSILVCGSRDWPADMLWFVTAQMIEAVYDQDESPKIIAGGARGVDTHAVDEAVRLRWRHHEEKADWSVTPDTPPERVRKRKDGSEYDVLAGYERNLRMLDMNPDLVLAFSWNGSGGTQHTIENARER